MLVVKSLLIIFTFAFLLLNPLAYAESYRVQINIKFQSYSKSTKYSVLTANGLLNQSSIEKIRVFANIMCRKIARGKSEGDCMVDTSDFPAAGGTYKYVGKIKIRDGKRGYGSCETYRIDKRGNRVCMRVSKHKGQKIRVSYKIDNCAQKLRTAKNHLDAAKAGQAQNNEQIRINSAQPNSAPHRAALALNRSYVPLFIQGIQAHSRTVYSLSSKCKL